MYSSKSLLPLSLIAFLALAGCKEEKRPAATAAPPPAIAVQTVAAATSEWPGVYEAVGNVRARTVTTLSSKVMGYVREMKVNVGDMVREGQLLVVLDSRDLDAQQRQAQAGLQEARSAATEVDNAIASAKAQLELTEVTFQRMKDLYEKKSVSHQEFDEAQMRLKVAQAGYDMALAKRKQLDSRIQQAQEGVNAATVMRGFTEIHAPFAGVVTEKRAESGSLASPGMPLLTIERLGGYRLEAAVEESRLRAVRLGQTVGVRLDAFPNEYTGRVSEIVPAVDAASRAFTVKIDLPAIPNLRSGLFGRARFPDAKRSVLTIPAAAVREQGQVQSVFVPDKGVARSRLVTLGARHGDQVEALSGLTAGEAVIAPIPAGVADGSRVEVRP